MSSHIVTVVLLAFAVCFDVVCMTANNWHFSGPNIAFHKYTFQKPDTFNATYPYFSYSASLAVDGNENNNFANKSCSHTSANSVELKNHIAQWMVNLGGTFYVSGIKIVNRKDLKDRLQNFAVYGCNGVQCPNTNNWFNIYDDKNGNKYNNDLITIEVNAIRNCTHIAINLPIRIDGGESYLTLCEVMIYAVHPVCNATREFEHSHLSIYENTGTVVNGLYTKGTVIKVSCKKGFQMIGESLVTCLSTGHFSSPGTLCTAVCNHINITNGRLDPNQKVYRVGNKANIVCDNGFLPRHQDVTCMFAGVWSDHNMSDYCEQVQCDYPGKPDNGHYIIGLLPSGNIYTPSSSLPFNSAIMGKCDIGFESKGIVRYCKINKSWNGTEPLCKKKECKYPGYISNSVYLFGNRSIYNAGSAVFNTTISIECNKGFSLNGGKQLTCGADKIWGRKPVCMIVICEFPENPIHGWYKTKDGNGTLIRTSTGQANYNDTIYITCEEGYISNSTSKFRKCLETKEWSGISGQCILVTCKRFEQLEGGFYNYTKDEMSEGFPYNTVVTAHCHQQFNPSDTHNRTRRCTEEGNWDSVPATCVSVATETKAEESSKRALIGGLSAAAVASVSVALAVFFWYRSRRRDQDKSEHYMTLRRPGNASNNLGNTNDGDYAEIQEASFTLPVASMANSASLQSQQPYYSFTDVTKFPKTTIQVKDLQDLDLTGNVAKVKFEKEFQNLLQGMVRDHKEALKPQNIVKNYYSDLYAYDDTRVVLETDNNAQSDYINACYVHGFRKAKQYIASQGPTKDTLSDFWRMLWQTECTIVVMLTTIIEEGKTKGEIYWPEDGTCHTYGRLTVSTEKTEHFAQFVIRTLKIRNETSMKKSQIITQFQFTAWPDRGVPKNASSPVQFLNKVKYASVHEKGPIVVHCSTGVGRTGTFVAIDYLTDQGKTMDFVDVFGTITSMRTQRVNLVHTLEQYIFVHRALIESLMLPTRTAAKFPEAYKELLQVDMEKNKLKLFVEFETLRKVCPKADECDYMSSKLVRNRQKNRFSNILPVEEFMPSLGSNSNNGESRYINAVFLPSYKNRQAFIITQTPLIETRDDFWSLIWDHDVHTIVMMNSVRETTDSERYWPDNDETTVFANIEITSERIEEMNDHQVVSLSVKKYAMKRQINQIRCGSWPPMHELPDSPEVIINLMELVQASQRLSGNHTILVHCMNGADRSGLYCVMSAVLERMKIEKDVALAQVVAEMRNAREQIIPSLEQYQFCHETVLTSIRQNDMYLNCIV